MQTDRMWHVSHIDHAEKDKCHDATEKNNLWTYTSKKSVQNCQVKVLVSLEVTMCSRIKNLMGARLGPES